MPNNDNEIMETLKFIVSKIEETNNKIDFGFKEVNTRLSKLEIDVETLKDNQKAIIEGQQTSEDRLNRKIDEAVEELKTQDNLLSSSIKAVTNKKTAL